MGLKRLEGSLWDGRGWVLCWALGFPHFLPPATRSIVPHPLHSGSA